MELYLANQDTQFILYKPIKVRHSSVGLRIFHTSCLCNWFSWSRFQNNIVSSFAKLQTMVNEKYETEDQLLIGCPTPEQVSVLLSSTILSKKHSTSDNPLKEVEG